jgi:hypothetical protein
MTRNEIVEAFQAVEGRLEELVPLVRAQPEAPLLSGDWRVRDALSHVAARGNPIPRVLTRLNEVTEASGSPRPVRDIHEINAEQVRTRAGQEVDALIDELQGGHREALQNLDDLDEDVLERRLPVAFSPGELSVAEFIVVAGPRHEGNHLDDIEAALKKQ